MIRPRLIPPTEYVLCASDCDAHDFLYHIILIFLSKFKSLNIERCGPEVIIMIIVINIVSFL